MATFSDIKAVAERTSYQVSYLAKTRKILDEVLAEENEKWYSLCLHTGDGGVMELYDVPKDEIKRLVTEYRINKLKESIEAGKKEIAEMVDEVVTEY